MRKELPTLLVIGLIALATASPAAAARTMNPAVSAVAASNVARARVQVRVYDTASTPAANQSVALREAADVLAAAGIEVTWVPCGQSGPHNPHACELPLARSEVSVRLVNRPGAPSARGTLSLGYSLVDTSIATGTLATVYVDRVQWLTSRTDVSTPAVLGMAIAHELGHLLLGTNAHAGSGLMRAVWSRQDLQRHEPADWLFSPAESETMIRGLRERQVQVAAIGE